MIRMSLRNNWLKFTILEKSLVTDDPYEVQKSPVEVHDFRKSPIISDEIQKSILKTMQDEWQFCLHLHHGRRPLFIPGCRCGSRNDWACYDILLKVEIPIHDNDLILTPIIAPQSG
jgi:hypothetical protein